MANRRMFSKRLINSAKFLKMGIGAQALYFHLCMNADDDGIVEAFSVRRMVGANDDDLNNLVGRGFVTPLDTDNEIYFVNDWLEHNKIRADRKVDSMYAGLLKSKMPDVKLIESKERTDRRKSAPIDVSPVQEARTLTDGQPHDTHGSTVGRPVGNQWSDSGASHGQPDANHGSGNGPLRIGKDRLGQDRLGEGRQEDGAHAPTRPGFFRPSIKEIEEYCKEKGYQHVDAEYFWNYYENIDWKVGKNKMKNWKLAVSNWEKRQKEFDQSKGQAAASQEIMQSTDERLWPF